MFLNAILTHKQEEIEARKRLVSPQQLQTRAEQMPPPRDFVAAIRNSHRRPALIAEVKIASPSLGTLCSREKAFTLPEIYVAGGAACLSARIPLQAGDLLHKEPVEGEALVTCRICGLSRLDLTQHVRRHGIKPCGVSLHLS